MKTADGAPLIFVIEDDAAILRGLTFNLEAEGYQVRTASDGASGLSLLQAEDPDVLILDLMLPELSGYEICRKLRDEGRDTPILMLTARGEETDRVLGLDLGADDYVTKPFSVRELLARVRALVRRHRKTLKLPEEILIGDLVVDFRRYEARRGEESFKMTRKEFAVLKVLATHGGKWSPGGTANGGVGFRASADDPDGGQPHPVPPIQTGTRSVQPPVLITVHGVGYKLVV